jgi:hypothetical protein
VTRGGRGRVRTWRDPAPAEEAPSLLATESSGRVLATECRIVAASVRVIGDAGIRLAFAAMVAATCRPPRSVSFVRELLTQCPANVAAWLPGGWRVETIRGGVWIIHRTDPAGLLELRFKPLRRKPGASWLTSPEHIAAWHRDLYRPLDG